MTTLVVSDFTDTSCELLTKGTPHTRAFLIVEQLASCQKQAVRILDELKAYVTNTSVTHSTMLDFIYHDSSCLNSILACMLRGYGASKLPACTRNRIEQVWSNLLQETTLIQNDLDAHAA